jgi:hypothetical protein
MTQKRRFAELHLALVSIARRTRRDERLPIWTAAAVITGGNLVLWLLIAVAVNYLWF